MKDLNVRQVFQDPITELKPEGKAILVKKLSDEGEFERWKVRFLEDGRRGGLYERWIRKEL